MQCLFSVEGRDIDISTQRCLDKGDGNLADDVIVIALEKVVRLHVDEYV